MTHKEPPSEPCTPQTSRREDEVFVSHTGAHDDLALALCQRLEEQGIQCTHSGQLSAVPIGTPDWIEREYEHSVT